MARARYIHPTVMDSPSVHKLGPSGSFFWVAIILLADDEGRFHDVPEVLRGKTYPYPHSGVSLKAVKSWLATMAAEGMIFRYVAPNGSRYAEIVNFKSYNKPSHAKPSKIPAPISGNIPEKLPEELPEKFRAGLGGVGLDRVGCKGAPLRGAPLPSPTPQSEPHTSPAPAPPAGSPSAPAADRPAPTPVEPPAPRWTPPNSPPPGARPAPVATSVAGFSPERVKLLLDTCLATSHDNRDFARPWLNRTFGSMFNRLRGDEQVALEREFAARYGYGIDTGPQGNRTPTTPAAGTPDPVPSRIRPVPFT